MILTCTNRRGVLHYLHAGKTKTGQDRYYFSANSEGTLLDQIPEGHGLVGEVARVVSVMPLWKLQRVGNEVVDFLYPNVRSGRSIRFRASNNMKIFLTG